MSRKQRRKKYIERNKKSDAQRSAQGKKALIWASVIVFAIVAVVVISLLVTQGKKNKAVDAFDTKANELKQQVLSTSRDSEIKKKVAEDLPNEVVFLSVCNGDERSKVFTGTGSDRESAWQAAYDKALEFVKANDYNTRWLKADLVRTAKWYSEQEFSKELHHWRHEFFRSGIAFDGDFDTALLEAELNGGKILDYDNECINTHYLKNYLKKQDRAPLSELPDEYVLFRCIGWICDEDGNVYDLISDDADYGRRKIDNIDKDYAATLVKNASGFLMNQVKDDGSFIYGIYPRFDREIENYNIVRHASTLWSLICQYKMTKNEELVPIIDRAVDYMIKNGVVYKDDNTAYLLETKNNEIKLGGCGVAVIALSEYMDTFKNDKYLDVAEKLGNGILTMFDENTGEYYHVLNGDFTEKEPFRTVYYDGEATFALCRLYSLTKDQKWLDAAETAVDHFIAADYTQYKDHWVAYAMNEITQYDPDVRYFSFGLKNAQVNLDRIYNRDTTYHTYFELLMSTFELYDRAVNSGLDIPYLDNEFDKDYFLKTIYKRADHMLNGYFYPEYAMYMANPSRILDTFMVRHDGYRVRIDDVQHNVGGYYLYYKDYDKLVQYGLLEAKDSA